MRDWIKKPLEFWRGLDEHNRLAILLILTALLLFAHIAGLVISSPG